MAVATGTAILIASGLAATTAVTSGLVSADAARDAAREQRKALSGARADLETGVQSATELQQPFLERGTQAFNQLSDIVQAQAGQTRPEFGELPSLGEIPKFSFGLEDIQNDPGIQFAQEQARKTVEASAAARGGVLGAGTLQELQDRATGLSSLQSQNAFNRKLGGFNQNLAGRQQGFNELIGGRQQEFSERQQVFNEEQQLLNNLSGIAQVGPQTASNLSNISIGQAGRSGDLGIQLGNVNAAEQVAQGRAINQGLQGVTGGITDALLLQSILGNKAPVKSGILPQSGPVLPTGAGDLANLNRNVG